MFLITDLMMRLLPKLIRLASNKVYYFLKNLIKVHVYFVYPHIPLIGVLIHMQFVICNASDEF